jgi:hypothetical protein
MIEKGGIEINNKKLMKIVQFLLLFSVVVFLVKVFYFDNLYFRDRVIESIKNEEYEGVIVNRYYDKKNHNTPMLVFSNFVEVPIYGQFYSQIKIGDSVVKKKNDTKIVIYRQNEVIILDNINVIK